MAEHWEKFMDGPTIRGGDRLHVTLNSKGVFQFNRRAFETLGSPEAAVLYFEKDLSIVGIEPAHIQLRESFPFNNRQDTYWTINAIPFCRRFGIKLEGTEAFHDPELAPNGILRLSLRSTRRIYGPGGRKKKHR